ncbi:nucleoside-diphosphate kinase [Nocardia yamanashiensis]|uniref:nucleoside-diphosphate kinase n=1 Tax=Nocardia yamanashiensis TaxID=209247 RepID=UPI000830FA4B|nr:nucleoside-diphosphate kinase [Nocardia yamanashiensis]
MTGDTLRTLLTRLTPSTEKVDAYLDDTYVLEAVEQLERLNYDTVRFAHDHALLLFKPDAIAARAVESALEWLRDNGFEVVGAHRVTLSRHVIRALWYFAWNIASLERRRLAALLMDLSDAMVLVVRETDAALPTSIRLTQAKGPTDPGKRVPGQLRYLLGRYSYLLNLVHTPDDPADVVRELGIYFDEPTRAEVVAQADAGRDRAAEAAVLAKEIYAEAPARSFDRAAAIATLVGESGRPAPESDADCAAWLHAAWDAGRDLDPWATVVLGSYVLPMRTPGTRIQSLPQVTARDWLEERP